MMADQPVDFFTNDLSIIEERITAGKLDTVLIVIDPEGKPIAVNNDSFTEKGEFNSDAINEGVPLTADGDYQIQARSDRDFYGGSYTLVIESKQYTMDPDDLASFAGRWYDENWGLFVVFSIGDGWLPYVTSRDFIGYIVPVGEVEFLDSVWPFTIEFKLDENGYPAEYIIYYPDRTTREGYRVEE